ncbi:hypothetical protein [Vibrio parahaemolyticus]|uniref:hypothetical protein n=1 Tax=Vibrio parahaemolyticus TaxID=670 RepID=UPI000789AB54|nr:hypothetical protein [Vibrio parahaemolyticus]KYO58418.1 hypothetical protein AU461_23155 [Vibrio parahaemolyticus]KYX47741.1 hypothetical protein AU389_02055 [Vibrio parahaemolyticus]TPB41762.1 hypothetical protein DXJ78_24000 [Vibrio parahaemolyticus]
MKKMLMALVVMLFALPALAFASPDMAMTWDAALVVLFGETGKQIVFWVSIVLVLWSQLRQLIPPEWIAKLPEWLINVLEFLAANKGQSANESYLDPKWRKRTGV